MGVERREAPTVGALCEALELADEPVVFVGAARGWPALSDWTPERLGVRLGHVGVKFKRSTCHQHPDFHRATLAEIFDREQAPLATFLERVTSGPSAERSRYLFTGEEHPLVRQRDGVRWQDPELSSLLGDVSLEALVSAQRLYSVWAWFSGPGVRTWLHYDNNGCHNLNAQLQGNKRCTLYAPSALSALLPFTLGGGNPAHNCSRIDVEGPRVVAADSLATSSPRVAVALQESLTAFGALPRFEVELHAGDVLFIPAWWWHTFEHVGDFNANLNVWWKPTQPRHNAVSRRQWLLDLAQEAGLREPMDSTLSQAMSALDRAACVTGE